MFDFYRGPTPQRQAGETWAYLCGANGQNCPTKTTVELAAWFQGFAVYARRLRGK